jgi:peroxiredoxin
VTQRLKTKPVQILAVSVDEDWKRIDQFFLEIKLTPSFMVLLDKNKAWAESFGTHKFPETYLLSKSGKILRKWIGTVDWSDAKIWREIDEMISKN